MRTERKAAQTESFWEEGERGLSETSAKCHPQTRRSPKHLGQSPRCVFVVAWTPVAEMGPSWALQGPRPRLSLSFVFYSIWGSSGDERLTLFPSGLLAFPDPKGFQLENVPWKQGVGGPVWRHRVCCIRVQIHRRARPVHPESIPPALPTAHRVPWTLWPPWMGTPAPSRGHRSWTEGTQAPSWWQL